VTTPVEHELRRAADLIASSKYFVAFTGAGISTPSGIPDFRSAGTGLWQRDDPMKVASATAFRQSPRNFYNWLRPLLRVSYSAHANDAHLALATLEKAGKLQAVITQNIDELHQKAGSVNVVELHGSIHRFYCPANKEHGVDFAAVVTSILSGEIPLCATCGTVLRPDITLYEEELAADDWLKAENEIALADLLLVAGSSLEVTPAALLPFKACRNGCKIILVNHSATSIDPYAQLVMRSDVAECIPAMVALLNQRCG